MTSPENILEKYHDIIAEEVNVKNVSLLSDDQQVTVQYVPLGNTLGEKFGKDTWRIIGSAKQGNARLVENWQLKVEDWDQSWLLDTDQYEVRYSWFDGKNQIVEDGTMIELNLELTDELIQEGIAREISRFLNQMRKDADFEVSDRVDCGFVTESDDMSGIIAKHDTYLKTEALLRDIDRSTIQWDHTAIFEYEGNEVTFTLKR